MAQEHRLDPLDPLRPSFRANDDVMSYILELCTSFWDGPSIRLIPDFQPLPSSRSFLSMNLVCRWFRAVAILTPRCWKEIIIYITDEFMTSPNLLKTLLQRSGALFFNLSIYVDTKKFNRTQVGRHLVIMSSHVDRCSRIEFHTGEQEILADEITEAIQGFALPCTALRSVRLAARTNGGLRRTQGEMGDPWPRVNLTAFWGQSSGQIECVEIDFVSSRVILRPQGTVGNLQLPVKLRQLRIYEGLEKDVAIKIARQCPSLELFELYIQEERLSEEELNKPLHFSFLKTFQLRAEALLGGFPKLEAAACENLCLGRLETTHADDWLFGSDGTDRMKFPVLKRLSFVNVNECPAGLVDFLSHHPTLEEILIRGPMFGDDEGSNEDEPPMGCAIFDRLATVSTMLDIRDPFLPSLQTLWYEMDPDFWREGRRAEIAKSLRQLLTSPFKTPIRVLIEGKIPRELIELANEFQERFYPLNSLPPEWAR
ncbi:hypothetical protein DL93DRAFT_162011 [Clavulina sp. PMI_390]|nr:hypothetical protein DL93DRAFT_162011 [Clavulina sp. PMI_390]